jgi:hypothetical protein
MGGLHVKHAVQRGICVPTKHLLWDRGKPQKTLIELAGKRTFRMQTDFQPAVRDLNTQNLPLVPISVLLLYLKKKKFTYLLLYF